METMFISSALSLLALSAGTFLLAKTHKDGLGIFYKIVAWFIIVGSVMNMASCAMHSAMRFCKMHYFNAPMMHEKFGMHEHNMYYGEGWQSHHPVCYEGNYMNGGTCSKQGCSDMCREKCMGTMEDSTLKKQNEKPERSK